MIPFLLLLAVGVGQQDTRPCGLQSNSLEIRDCATHPPQVKAAPGVDLVLQKNGDVIAQPATFKCGKYKHLEDVCSTSTGTCSDKCVDDLHPLKESEYQEIMERLKKLEKDSVRMTEPVIACDSSRAHSFDFIERNERSLNRLKRFPIYIVRITKRNQLEKVDACYEYPDSESRSINPYRLFWFGGCSIFGLVLMYLGCWHIRRDHLAYLGLAWLCAGCLLWGYSVIAWLALGLG